MSYVSVIIPSYNNALWLEDCLQSCIDQGFDYLKEIILVDDQSTDHSWNLAEAWQERYPEHVKIFKNPIKGGNNARNFGFLQASAKYIQWLDSDDALLPGKFEAQVKALEKEPSVDIVYSDWQLNYYEESSKEISSTEQHSRDSMEPYLKALIKDQWCSPNNYLLRYKAAFYLNDLQAWNPLRKVSQDREYFTLAAIHGLKFHYVPGNFALYRRWTKSSVSSMDFKERLIYTIALEHDFYQLIKTSSHPKNVKEDCLKILNSQALTATYYNPEIQIPRSIRFLHWDWKSIHPKLRPYIGILWMKQLFRNFLKFNSEE